MFDALDGLKDATLEKRSDKEFVLKAVESNVSALKFASGELKKDKDILDAVKRTEKKMLKKAVEFTKENMKDVPPRKFNNKPAYLHPMRVLELVTQYEPDDIFLQVAAVLHDIIEDTDKTKYNIRELFGDEVMNLVVELTSDKDKCNRVGKAKYLSDKMNNMTDRALLTKLCDRLDNVSDFDIADKEWRNKYSEQTETILASLHPLNEKQQKVADRIWDIVHEFE